MEFLYKLFFEKHSGKAEALAMIYNMVMCAFIVKWILQQ
jgi:hypothetical protein